ncbi:MAG: tyrosine-type recombinase/integrase [Nanoarchaeota archaeon]|nr:tyrosine-type recombinase/integrase [Nanoarchaeota archaeon]
MKIFHQAKREKEVRQKDRLRGRFVGFVDDLRLQGFSQNTIDAYLWTVGRFMDVVKKQPKFVTTADIKGYLLSLLDTNKKARTVNLALSALKAYFGEFMGKKLLGGVKHAKVPLSLPRVLETEEIRKMITETRLEKHRLVIRLLYETGIRVGECVMVKVDHIHDVAKLLFIHRGKGNKDRYVPLSAGLYADMMIYLSSRKRDSAYLFDNSFGGHLTRRTAQSIVDTAAKRAGLHLHVHPHMMRASCVTHLMQRGVEI